MDGEGGEAQRPLIEKKGDVEDHGKKTGPSDSKATPALAPINYAFLNGLRGLGALAVYLYHDYNWFPEGGPAYTDGKTDPAWITTFKATPFTVFVHGYFWVIVFFILSGFVLPLRWFKTHKADCIWSGCFRRYFRLMIPYWVIISIYYLVAKGGWTQARILPNVKSKNFT